MTDNDNLLLITAAVFSLIGKLNQRHQTVLIALLLINNVYSNDCPLSPYCQYYLTIV